MSKDTDAKLPGGLTPAKYEEFKKGLAEHQQRWRELSVIAPRGDEIRRQDRVGSIFDVT